MLCAGACGWRLMVVMSVAHALTLLCSLFRLQNLELKY